MPRNAHLRPLLLLPLAVLLLAACDREPSLPRLGPEAVILAFGDSLTYGTGAGEGEAYPVVLARLLGLRVINAGVPGEISEEGVARLPALLEEHRPDLVVLCHGGNDLLRRLDAEALRGNLRRMIAAIHSAGGEVVLVGVPQPGLFLAAAPLYGEVAKEFRLSYEDEVLSDILDDRTLKSDAIHPNAAGYSRLAEALERRIRRAQR
jgi:lysophospholipase L1-like esterase